MSPAGAPHKVSHDRVRALHDAGRNGPQIARELGVSPRTIQRARAALGLNEPTPAAAQWRATPEWKAEVRRLVDDGWSIREIARRTGNTDATIKRHFPDAGWTPEQSGAYALAIAKANAKLRKSGHKPLPSADDRYRQP